MRIHVFALALLLAVAACQELLDPLPVQLLVQTEGTTFVRDPAAGLAAVPFTMENQSNRTIYVARCGERLMAALDRWESGQWVQHSGDLCQAIYTMDPLALAPGTSLSSVRGVLEPGRYRLRPGIRLAPTEASEWSIAVSNEFMVE